MRCRRLVGLLAVIGAAACGSDESEANDRPSIGDVPSSVTTSLHLTTTAQPSATADIATTPTPESTHAAATTSSAEPEANRTSSPTADDDMTPATKAQTAAYE